jgi:hypothetical protein
MARMLDVNEKFVGQEPKFSGEVTEKNLGDALSWYSINRKSKDSQKYASAYFKKVHKLDIQPVIKSKPTQLGFVCRMLTNGGVLSPERQKWFDSQIEELKDALAKKETVEVIEKVKKGPNIQDRIREKVIECIGELEGQIDNLIVSKFANSPQPYAVMHTLGIKSVHTKSIVDWSKEKRNEFEEVMNTDEFQVKEGYSNFKKTELKKIIAYCDQVIVDCGKINNQAVAGRKPRKRKAKSPEQLVAKIKHCLEFKDLSLTSVKTTDIIESMQLWVYNTKTRKLGVYHAEDAGGLSVKGSSIVNFSEMKSIQKTLRKPEVVLPEVINGGKVFLRNAIDSIKAVESKLTGRINADTILLKVMK